MHIFYIHQFEFYSQLPVSNYKQPGVLNRTIQVLWVGSDLKWASHEILPNTKTTGENSHPKGNIFIDLFLQKESFEGH